MKIINGIRYRDEDVERFQPVFDKEIHTPRKRGTGARTKAKTSGSVEKPPKSEELDDAQAGEQTSKGESEGKSS
jgi:hypothetical protein